MPGIKICGISDLDTLERVCELDVNYIGFVHHPGSVRHVDVLFLAKLIKAVPEPTKTAVVLVNPVDSKLEYLFEWCRPDYIQLHGIESVDRVAAIKEKFSTKIIKAIPVGAAGDVQNANQYKYIADMMLFDTKMSKGVSGGTGKTFDWQLLANFKSDAPWMLSGGLSAENVVDAVRATSAPIVDASSHLEVPAKSGKKDLERIKAFVQQAHAA